MSDEDFLADLDRQSERQTQRVREMLYQHGRPDLVAELDAKMKDIRLGIASAQGTWHALSAAQRRILEILAGGRWLVKASASRTFFDANGEPHALAHVCRAPTVRNLMARELIAWAPDRKVTITERGRFVLRHGPVSSPAT